MHKMLYYCLVEYTKIGVMHEKTEILFEFAPEK